MNDAADWLHFESRRNVPMSKDSRLFLEVATEEGFQQKYLQFDDNICIKTKPQ